MCDTPIPRVTGCVSSLRVQVGHSPCKYSVVFRVNRGVLGPACVRKLHNPFLRATKCDSCGRKCINYQANLVIRIPVEGRAEFVRTWGPNFDPKGAGGGRMEGG